MKLKLTFLFIYCLIASTLKAQNVVHGTIKDVNGVSLPGVNITEKGTSNATLSNLNGEFSIVLKSQNATLVFSYVGFVTKEVAFNNQTNLNVILDEDVTKLNEVVVVGYGTVKKSDLTGAVSSVSSKDLVDRPVATIDQAIQGRASGVLARTNSAAPGGGMNIVIRGTGSINSNTSPLYVVNGIPVSNIDNIPPDDVKSVEILKDASATAIYGSRGANGVVLVTTKTGKLGKPQISYNNRITSQSIRNDYNLMNGQEFANFYTDWELANGSNASNVFYNGSDALHPLPENAMNTDWFKAVTRTGLQSNHNLNISGGSENNTYSVSMNYLDEKGVIIGSDYSRLSLTMNNTYKVNKWVDFGLNLILSSDKTDNRGQNSDLEGSSLSVISATTKMIPTLPIYDANGNYQENILPGSQNRENPVAAAKEVLNNQKSLRGVGKIYFDFKPFKGFDLKTSLGTNLINGKTAFYNSSNTITGALLDGEASNNGSKSNYYINEYLATYHKSIKRNDFTILGGFSYEGQTNEGFNNYANGFFTDAYQNNNIGAASFRDANSYKNKWQLASFIGRMNYTFDNKYLLTVTGRYDGSSKFSKDKRWGFFPSAAAAWKISDESFFPKHTIVSFLKLRTSYGEAGNSNINSYNSLATYGLSNYTLGNAIVPGVSINRLANANFGWETLKSSDIGLDVGLFKDRVNLTADAYIKTTQNLIASASLIETSGLSSANINVGELQNKGLEFSMDSKIITRGNFKWSATGNISFNKNKVTKWNGDPSNNWRIGNPVGVMRGVAIDGLINTQEELNNYGIAGAHLGDYKQIDQDGNGIINGEDQVIIFNPNPDFTYGFSHDFSYKSLSLSLSFYGSKGGQIFNDTKRYFLFTGIIRANMSRELINNYWTPSNPNAQFPALNSNTSSNIPVIENGSFLRLQNILLAYKLPKLKGMDGLGLSLFASAQNVATWTKYTGLDPDANSNGDDPKGIGVDRASYPTPKSYTLGVRLNF